MVISVVSLDIKTYSVNDIIVATDDVFSSLEQREIDIARQRWGTERYVHYDDIGKNYNLTRERIRQILVKIKNKFVKRNEKYFNEWFKLFLEELIDKPVPISTDF
ncbi:MAG: hypothetical protein CO128_00350 [Ignavibacteriales bacterium CG_4_9_14_3_um_filter_30_11]|nr:MAG: hypothetical protein CO128_00350 [Ignavibacteriales bacterium CG_4_9_14_3_um_filter_30_11]